VSNLGERLDLLSRPPGRAWPEGVLHHGARIVLLVVLALSTSLFFPVSPVADFPVVEKGMIVEEDIIAEVPFSIFKSPAELAQEQDEAAAAVAPIFRYDATAIDTMRVRVAAIMDRFDDAASDAATAESRLRQTLAAYSLPTRDDVVALLRPAANRASLRASLGRIVEQELRRGIAHPNELENLRAQQIRVTRGEGEQIVPRDSVLLPTSLYVAGERYLPATAPAGLGQLQQLILIRQFTPTLRLDRAATEAARQSARNAVNPVRRDVIRGERVVAAREQLRDEDVERLRAYQSRLAELGRLERGARARQFVGGFMLNLMLLGILGAMLFFFRPGIYGNMRHVALLAGLAAALTAGSAAMAGAGAPASLIPIAFPALVIAVLWDGRLALTFALVMALLLNAQTPLAGLSPRILMVVGGAAAALSVRVVRRRAQALILGGVIGGAYVAACIALGLLLSWSAGEVAGSAAWGVVNGLASAVFALGLLPVFEAITRITTDQTLLELADLNRPLLKRLSLEAGGTYAHSINVANLSEAAARAIGANPLLVRVGAYYHDVGKMEAPQYYVENQARGRNPHDRLDPGTSARIVRQHVLDGLRLAREAKLPDAVQAFIPEHHGTQRIGFFYEKAKEADGRGEVNVEDFHYPGPLPETRETAIVMLADSVESASKVLPEPTPERIRDLVDRIVETKVQQGQLDRAPLTLADLARVKEQFVAVLNGMYHRRLDYPTMPMPPAAEAAPEAAGHGAGA
jgi:putative nucleotidyltransferase with HDIG domain